MRNNALYKMRAKLKGTWSQSGNYPDGHSAWAGMRQRCLNPTSSEFARYGGRGIKICDRWLTSFETFLEDMGPKPTPKHSVDRIDNDGNYEPSNCRWATVKEQNNNRCTSVFVTIGRETKTVAQWDDLGRLAVDPSTVYKRIRSGWNPELAATSPRDPRGRPSRVK
jgi:hypothetical protein